MEDDKVGVGLTADHTVIEAHSSIISLVFTVYG